MNNLTVRNIGCGSNSSRPTAYNECDVMPMGVPIYRLLNRNYGDVCTDGSSMNLPQLTYISFMYTLYSCVHVCVCVCVSTESHIEHDDHDMDVGVSIDT